MKLFLTGGFLGSGKTTAIRQACSELIRRGIRVAVITNDQGDQLVDSEFISHIGIPMREVSNSCFCCNYPLLEEHMKSLYDQFNPGIIFAESVGSCADLVATITRPLAKFYPGIPVVLTVFADAQLLWSLMNGDSCFLDESVRYIYKKQLEEADILVINKIDLLGDADLEKIEAILQMEYPGKILLFQNSLQQEDIKQWVDVMNNFEPAQTRKALIIDYDIYGQGEAALAWLDKNIVIETTAGSAAAVCEELIHAIYNKVSAANLPIGHLKFFINDGAHQQKISYTTKGLPGNAEVGFDNSSRKLSLLINARVQTDPAVLQQIIAEAETDVMAKSGCRITVNKFAAFQPGFPKPTYRMAGEEI